MDKNDENELKVKLSRQIPVCLGFNGAIIGAIRFAPMAGLVVCDFKSV